MGYLDEVNLAHEALSSLAAYEGLKSGEAELYREAHPNMLEWGSFLSVWQIGMGRFKKAWGRMKAWLQKQYLEVSATVAGLSSTPDTATPPPGISHLRARSLDAVPESPSAQAYPSSPIDGGHQSRCPYPCAWPDSRIEGDPQLPPQNFVMVVHPMWRPPPPPTMALGLASGSRCDGKGYAASSDTNTYKYPGCGGESHASGPAGHSCQVDYAPTTSGCSSYGNGSTAMASVIALAPASSKAEAISLATEPVDMEDAATEEASPITPPRPLVELGTRAPGTPGSAFGVLEWTDPTTYQRKRRYRKLQLLCQPKILPLP